MEVSDDFCKMNDGRRSGGVVLTKVSVPLRADELAVTWTGTGRPEGSSLCEKASIIPVHPF